jgi:hypothetical protein
MTTYNANLSSVQNMLEFFGQFSQNAETSPKRFKLAKQPKSEAPTNLETKSLGSASGSAIKQAYDGSLRVKIPIVSPTQYKFINWEAVSHEKLDMVEYYRYAEYLDWKAASINIDPEIVPLFAEYIDWPVFVATHPIGLKNLKTLGTPLHTIKARVILETQPLTEEELTKYINVLDIHDGHPVQLWHVICRTQVLSEAFIEKHAEKLDWEEITTWQIHLSKEFLKRHRHRVSREYMTVFTSRPRDVIDYIYN